MQSTALMIFQFITSCLSLEAVSQLDAEVDEYPLNETFINDLYDIAKENTGSFTDVSTDIPESQLTLKPLSSNNWAR